MRIITFTPDDRRALAHDRYHHPDPRVQRKMEVLWLKSHGLDHDDIAAYADVSRRTVQRYLDEYISGGLPRLRRCRWHQPQSTLVEHEGSLEEYFLKHPPRSAKQAQAVIEQRTGIRRGLSQVRHFLKDRLGLRWRKTGAIPVPPKKTIDEHAREQAAFLETKLGPRLEQARLPGMTAWADDETSTWEEMEFDRYGLHAKLKVKTIRALYYKAGKDRLLTIVLVRDTTGGRPDQMFYCTRADWDARAILGHYACRWSVEVMHFNAKQMMGLEDPSNRTALAVERTAPVGLALYSLTLVWFHRGGHRSVSFPDRPWYLGKEEPSYADILAALRRESWRGQFAGVDWERGGEGTPLAQLIEFVSRAA